MFYKCRNVRVYYLAFKSSVTHFLFPSPTAHPFFPTFDIHLLSSHPLHTFHLHCQWLLSTKTILSDETLVFSQTYSFVCLIFPIICKQARC
ncbi:hypothetical protein RJT34_18035 [Clitoria ternatea]|uniref:Uncharacterized protein n=1 Tax=Clitoria ternatea TaxID=43366 RepID=A0AAN9PE90_CLITE